MEQYTPEAEVTQLLVLGRGMDGNKLSNASFDRALATQGFCESHTGIERVVFSSGRSSMADTPSVQSEAVLMVSAARLPENVRVYKEEDSTNTIENFINSATLLDPDQITGVLAHRPHLPRALLIAGIALPGQVVVGIPAELWGARSESRASLVIEKLQLAWTGKLLQDVKPGDLAALRERNLYDQQIKQRLGKIAKPVARILGISLPQQYK